MYTSTSTLYEKNLIVLTVILHGIENKKYIRYNTQIYFQNICQLNKKSKKFGAWNSFNQTLYNIIQLKKLYCITKNSIY